MDLSRYIALNYPEALILGIVVAWLYWRRLPHRNFWRTAMVVLAIALLGYPAVVRTGDSVDLYILADRSRSIGDEGREKQMELIDLAGGMLRPGDRIGVISFNDRAHVEQPPQSAVAIRGFEIPFPEDASNLSTGLELILNQSDRDRASRILVLSDGDYTGQDPARIAHLARQERVPIHYRNLARREIYNLAVRDVQLDEKTLANEPFRVSFLVNATYATPGRYRLLRDGRPVPAGEGADPEGWQSYSFQPGDNPIEFADAVRQPGIHSYRLEVEPADTARETLTRDNAAERYIQVIGERPVLLVNTTGAPDNLARALTAGGLPMHVVSIDAFRFTIAQLQGYCAVVLNNVPVLALTYQQLVDLRHYVEQEGGGLLVAGGNRSFGAGGYYKTAIEPILPVTLEDRQQSKKISTAFSIVMDRSGSMAMTTPSGQTKIALASNAASESINLMSAADSLSVIVVDSLAHIVIPQQPVAAPAGMIAEVRTIQSMGGGIFTYTGLVAAGHELIKAQQLNKHILLFADAADAEEPGEYIQLLEDYVAAGITVSVVGLGTERDSDAEFLKDIARRGAGSVYFTEDARQLSQFFTADTLAYTRNSYIEDPTAMEVRAGALTLAPRNTWSGFAAGGYNLTFKRPEAELDIVTADEDQAPILAHWQRGLGRVAALAIDTQGPFAATPDFADIVLAGVRWSAGSEVLDNFQVKVESEGRDVRIGVEIAEEQREAIGRIEALIFAPDGTTLTRPMRWESHDRLAATVRLDQPGLHRGVIKIGDQIFRIGPMSIPVSPEFLSDRPPGAGPAKLAELARLTGGREALDLGPLFEVDSQVRSVRPFVIPLLVAFLLLLLAEVAEARFALLARMRAAWAAFASPRLSRWRKRLRVAPAPGRPAPRPVQGPADSAPRAMAGRPDSAAEAPAKAEPPSAPSNTPPVDDAMNYLGKSKAEAGRQLKGKRKE